MLIKEEALRQTIILLRDLHSCLNYRVFYSSLECDHVLHNRTVLCPLFAPLRDYIGRSGNTLAGAIIHLK